VRKCTSAPTKAHFGPNSTELLPWCRTSAKDGAARFSAGLHLLPRPCTVFALAAQYFGKRWALCPRIVVFALFLSLTGVGLAGIVVCAEKPPSAPALSVEHGQSSKLLPQLAGFGAG
jgi:hypothetical protein